MVKQDLVDQLEQIRQSEKAIGKTRQARVYHVAFNAFVRLIMGKHFTVDLYVSWKLYIVTELVPATLH